MLDAYQNPNGTYDGASAMAAMTGLSRAEILWTWERMRTLRAAGLGKEEAKEVIENEQIKKPWERS